MSTRGGETGLPSSNGNSCGGRAASKRTARESPTGSKQATSRLRQVVASVTSGEEADSEDDTSLNPVNDRGASSSSSDSSSNGEDSQVESEGKTPCTCIAPMLPNVNIPCMLFILSC
jgi:hypothetical protein